MLHFGLATRDDATAMPRGNDMLTQILAGSHLLASRTATELIASEQIVPTGDAAAPRHRVRIL